MSENKKLTKTDMQEHFKPVCEKCCCRNSCYNKNGGVWCYNGIVDGDADLCGHTLESAQIRLEKIKRTGV